MLLLAAAPLVSVFNVVCNVFFVSEPIAPVAAKATVASATRVSASISREDSRKREDSTNQEMENDRMLGKARKKEELPSS